MDHLGITYTSERPDSISLHRARKVKRQYSGGALPDPGQGGQSAPPTLHVFYSPLHHSISQQSRDIVLLHIPIPSQRRHRVRNRRHRLLRRERLHRGRHDAQQVPLLRARRPALALAQKVHDAEGEVRERAVGEVQAGELRDVEGRVLQELGAAADFAHFGVGGGDGEAAAEGADGVHR